MKTLIVACIQQKMRLPQTLEEYREDLRRFMRAAANKRARLVVFPELAGVMVIPPLLGGFQANLLKRADLARRRQASLWQKVSGGASGAIAGWFNTDFRQMTGALLTTQPQMVWDAYDDVFGGLAHEFDVTLVAPSAYLPDPQDEALRNLAVVYGPGGERLGYQAKRVLHPEDEDLAQPGQEWNVIQTPVGQIGLMLGGDSLYPEVGRLLAFQGAEMLIAQGAATERVLYEKLRSGTLARMQDNQLFAAISFLVGHNEFSRRQRDPFVGRSSVMAPQELTPRASGVLVEASNVRSESVLSAVWDFEELAELWETSDTPVRSQLPLGAVGPTLAQLYQRMKQLPKGADALLAAPDDQEPEAQLPESIDLHGGTMKSKSSSKENDNTLGLSDLPVVASVNSYWGSPNDEEIEAALPAHVPVPLTLDPDDEFDDDSSIAAEPHAFAEPEAEGETVDGASVDSADSPEAAAGRAEENQAEDGEDGNEGDEETQEMDALLEPRAEEKREDGG